MKLIRVRNDPRFRIGDYVEILSTIATHFSGMSGVITEVTVSRHAQTLDKYRVRFDDGAEQVFWDVQLRSLANQAVARSA